MAHRMKLFANPLCNSHRRKEAQRIRQGHGLHQAYFMSVYTISHRYNKEKCHIPKSTHTKYYGSFEFGHHFEAEKYGNRECEHQQHDREKHCHRFYETILIIFGCKFKKIFKNLFLTCFYMQTKNFYNIKKNNIFLHKIIY